ncbi:MAG: hypothetical protein KAV98_00100 [Dehalococcoidia bacterium]|nr:hypothetical protein [Dehalococcoidia bacterium]
MKQADIDTLADKIFALAREVEALARETRMLFAQQLASVTILYTHAIEPEISGTLEAYEMERMLRTMDGFCGLSEREWRRSAKARKQAVKMMRVTAHEVIRRLLRNVLEISDT